MKNLKVLFLICLTLCLANSAFSQVKFIGKVVDIIDGKTVILELQTGKLTAVLQYIEVPEAEQTLSQTVKDHLQNLTLNKVIEFKPLRITGGKTVGLLTIAGVDVSSQMLRDGAAWYALPEKSGQNAAQSEIYLDNEAQAKAEKRGVWGIANLKPAWQVRAETEEKRVQQEKIALEEQIKLERLEAEKPKLAKPVVRREYNSESQMWSQGNSDIPQNITTVGGLLMAYNQTAKIGFVGTPLLKLQISEKDGSEAIGIGVGYLYADDAVKGRQSTYLIGIESESRDFRFLNQNQMIVTADGVKINIGKAKRTARQNDFSVKEILTYEIKKSVIEKIANAKNVEVKVGDYQTKVPDGVQTLLQNLLNATK